ncbi:adenosine deaminase 2 [Diplogelasinospora grovesii]|uniref:Adenosine deaminase 2 n=1 Tax=Diplogelasinospora grovesii TaxID=303347 RepID=A0AAN6MUQ0_9PEZI|nr:adenosine deaminase 2 [Diplogelasinospora grovesii]
MPIVSRRDRALLGDVEVEGESSSYVFGGEAKPYRRTGVHRNLPSTAAVLNHRLRTRLGPLQVRSFGSVEAYQRARADAVRREGALAFDHACKTRAHSSKERGANEVVANEILQALKQYDNTHVYGGAPARKSESGQEHKRFLGDHFLSNADLIEKTELFKVAREMPKGAHLHIHFNANLLPNVLLDIAKAQKHMYIWSSTSLMPDSDAASNKATLSRCRLQFNIIGSAAKTQNIFSRNYNPRADLPGTNLKIPMPYWAFREEFAKNYEGIDIDRWLREKLVFSEEEAHDPLQTSDGAWDLFNARTQMMKGLFNYETAYRTYTYKCLQDFAEDNIQYAEIRPNFMSTNQVWKDDGSKKLDNWAIMELIIEVYGSFQKAHNCRVFKGLKIIYCTPRSFSCALTALALEECMAFKLVWPDWIAGFDLVGEESKGRTLFDFHKEFLDFIEHCKNPAAFFNRALDQRDGLLVHKQTIRNKLKKAFPGGTPEQINVCNTPLDIPFLFHCGETLEVGGQTDGNLYDALLLKAKRIGHGFALARHPYVMEQMKKENVCLELCPISNEILGLTPRVSNHAMYELLANNVHCTVNTDNGTLFRSRLSHDFYQVFAGKNDMTLHGWRQLIEWSIDHSCMQDAERKRVKTAWEGMWDAFCVWIIETYRNKVAKTKQ